MWWTPDGERILQGAEAGLFREALGMIVDMVRDDDEGHRTSPRHSRGRGLHRSKKRRRGLDGDSGYYTLNTVDLTEDKRLTSNCRFSSVSQVVASEVVTAQPRDDPMDWGARGRRFKSCRPDLTEVICSKRLTKRPLRRPRSFLGLGDTFSATNRTIPGPLRSGANLPVEGRWSLPATPAQPATARRNTAGGLGDGAVQDRPRPPRPPVTWQETGRYPRIHTGRQPTRCTGRYRDEWLAPVHRGRRQPTPVMRAAIRCNGNELSYDG